MSDFKTTSSIDWDFIVETIRTGKCVLFLGPGLYSQEDSLGVEKSLYDYLNIGNNENIQTYYPEDNLFLFSSRAGKTKTHYKIRSFYEEVPATAARMLDLVIKIP